MSYAVTYHNKKFKNVQFIVVYFVSFLSSPHSIVFNIDSESGELTTIVELDREEMATHVVEMLVEDGGSPRLNATATLNLVVVDVNDNPPVWTAGNGTTFTFNEVE